MIRITIAQKAESFAYPNKKSGVEEFLRKQTAYAHLVDLEGASALYPEKYQFLLGKKHPGLSPGEYTLHPSGFYVKNTLYGPELAFMPDRLTLVRAPVKTA